MSSICLSAALNLRCEGLTRTENVILLVPPAIEIIFSITLAFASPPDRGGKLWLLVLDGFVFFLLVLLDFLSQIIPRLTSTPVAFRVIDFVLAAASAVPILGYILFLYLFARINLLSSLPVSFRRVASFALLAMIPLIIAFNELGSLLGVDHRITVLQNENVVAVGFSNVLFQRMSLFFFAGTLALLTLFQASNFCLTFIRLVRAFLDGRRIELSKGEPDAPDEIHLFRGIGWLAGGLKLGAIETVVGFVPASFGLVLTRRVLRLFSRGTIIIGIIKGMDIVEDFERFEADVRRRISTKQLSNGRSQLVISKPRNSTFVAMSPQASSFHAAQWEKRTKGAGAIGPSPLSLGVTFAPDYVPLPSDTLPPSSPPPDPLLSEPPPTKERVTVFYDGKTAPVLNLRLSTLDMPVPPLPAVTARTRTSLYAITEASESPRTARTHDSVLLLKRVSRGPQGQAQHPSTIVSTSGRSVSATSDSLKAMRELAPHFPELSTNSDPGLPPGLPARADNNPESRSRGPEKASSAPSSTDVSPVNSIKRKPPPIFTPAAPQRPERRPPPLDLNSDVEDPKRRQDDAESPVSINSTGSHYSTQSHVAPATPSLTRASTLDTVPTTPGHAGPAGHPTGRHGNGVTAVDDRKMQEDPPEVEESRRERLMRLRSQLDRSILGSHRRHGELQRMHNDPVAKTRSRGRNYPIAPYSVEEVDEAWRRAGMTRIKTVNRQNVHTTPVTEHNAATRASLIAVEEEEIGFPDNFDENKAVAQSPVRLTRLDSEVLGEDDRRFVRQRYRG